MKWTPHFAVDDADTAAAPGLGGCVPVLPFAFAAAIDRAAWNSTATF